jgi:hypothetical protein
MTLSACHPDRRHYAKGLCTSCYKKKAYRLQNPDIRPPGSVDKFGYTCYRIGGIRVVRHRALAEKALGKSLPPKAVVHHHGPVKNDVLVICENQGYHLLLHRRQRALRACGNADWLCCEICGRYSAPEKLIVQIDPRGRTRRYHYRNGGECVC